MAELEVLRDAAVLIDDTRVAWVGPRGDAPAADRIEEVSGVIFPGFIDCHTHGVFGAPRLDDQERRALGVDYKAIAAAGGGILQSVRDLRARSEPELAYAWNSLGMLDLNFGQYKSGESNLRQAVAFANESIGEANPETAAYSTNLALALF